MPYFLQVNPITVARIPEEYLIAIGLQQTRPGSELQDWPADQNQQPPHAEEAAAAASCLTNGTGAEEGQAQLADQGQLHAAPWDLPHEQPAGPRWLTVVQNPKQEGLGGAKAPPLLHPVGGLKTSSGKTAQMAHTAPRPVQAGAGHPQTSSDAWQSLAKVAPLPSLQQQASSLQGSAQQAVPMGMPVGSTTRIVGRRWPGQPQYVNSQSANSTSRPGPGGALGEARGTKRAGDGDSKGKKRQRRGDRDRSVEGEGSGVWPFLPLKGAPPVTETVSCMLCLQSGLEGVWI